MKKGYSNIKEEGMQDNMRGGVRRKKYARCRKRRAVSGRVIQ